MQNSDPLPHHLRGLHGQGAQKCMSNPLISSAEAMHQHSHGPSLGTVENQAVRRAGVSAYRFVPMPKVFSDQAQTLPTEEAVIKIWQQVPCWPRSGAARSKGCFGHIHVKSV